MASNFDNFSDDLSLSALSNFSQDLSVDTTNFSSGLVQNKANRVNQEKINKSREARAVSASKADYLLIPDLPETEEIYRQQNPQATEADVQEYRYSKEEEIQAKNLNEELLYQNSLEGLRSNTAPIKDGLKSLSKFAINSGETLYGLVDTAAKQLSTPKNLLSSLTPEAVIESVVDNTIDGFVNDDPAYSISNFIQPDSNGGLDESLGNFSENFAKSRDIINESQSSLLNSQRAEAKIKSNLRGIRADERIQSRIDSGDSPLVASVKETADDIGYFLRSGLNDPGIILDQVLESAPDLVGGIAVGKFASKQLLKSKKNNLSEEDFQKFIGSEEGQKLTQRAATLANVGYAAAQEGISNGYQAKQEILNTDFDALKDSPDIKAYIKQGMSPEQAKQKLAEEVFNWTAGTTAVAAGAISFGSGSASLLASISNGVPLAKVFKGVLGKGAAGTASEAVEEGAQGLTGGAIGNYAVADAKKGEVSPQELTAGLGEQTAAGIISGGVSGGAVGSVGGIKGSISNTKDLAQAAKGMVIEPVNPENLDLDNEKYDPEKSFNTLVDTMDKYKDVPGGAEVVMNLAVDHANAATAKSNALKEDLDQAIENGDSPAKIEKLTKDYETAKAKAIEIGSRWTDFVKGLVQPEGEETPTADKVKEDFSETASEEEIAKKTSTYYNSPQTDKATVSALESVASNTALPTYQREQAQALIDNEKAKLNVKQQVNRMNKQNKDIGSVNNEVIEGGKGKIGINQWLSGISSAVANGSRITRDKNVNGLKRFAKQRADKFEQLSRIRSYLPEGRLSDLDFAELTAAQLADIKDYEETYQKLDGQDFKIDAGTFRSNLLGLLEAENNAAKTALASAAAMSPAIKENIDKGYKKEPLDYTPVSLSDAPVAQDNVAPTTEPEITQNVEQPTSEPPVQESYLDTFPEDYSEPDFEDTGLEDIQPLVNNDVTQSTDAELARRAESQSESSIEPNKAVKDTLSANSGKFIYSKPKERPTLNLFFTDGSAKKATVVAAFIKFGRVLAVVRPPGKKSGYQLIDAASGKVVQSINANIGLKNSIKEFEAELNNFEEGRIERFIDATEKSPTLNSDFLLPRETQSESTVQSADEALAEDTQDVNVDSVEEINNNQEEINEIPETVNQEAQTETETEIPENPEVTYDNIGNFTAIEAISNFNGMFPNANKTLKLLAKRLATALPALVEKGVIPANLVISFKTVDEVEKAGIVKKGSIPKGSPAFYDIATNQIVILDKEAVSNAPKLLIHEVIHAATTPIINLVKSKSGSYRNLSNQQIAGANRLLRDFDRFKSWLDANRDNLSESALYDLDYAAQDEFEYIAMALTENSIHKALRKVDSGNVLKSLLSSFSKTISKILGLKEDQNTSLIASVFAAFDEITDQSSKPIKYKINKDDYAQEEKYKENVNLNIKGDQRSFVNIDTWLKDSSEENDLNKETGKFLNSPINRKFIDGIKEAVSQSFTIPKDKFNKVDFSFPRVEMEQVLPQIYKDLGDSVGFDSKQLEQMAFGLISALNANMSAIVNNDAVQIKKVLELDKKDSIPGEALALTEVGMRDFEFFSMLGARARSNMGYSVNKDAKIGDFIDRLDKSLGEVLAKVLENNNIIQYKEMDISWVPKNPSFDATGNPIPKTYKGIHVVLDQDAIKTNMPAVAEMLGNVQTMPVVVVNDIAKYFGNDSDIANSYPRSKPPKDKKKGDHKTPLDFPARNNDAVNEYQKTKWVPNAVMTSIIGANKLLNEGLIKAISGYDFREDNETLEKSVHVSDLPGILGKNQGIKNSITYFKKWQEVLESFTNGEHYYEHFGTKNQRMMMKGLFNPQGDKFHRHLSLPAATVNTEINLNSNKAKSLFKLAVLESLGESLNKANLADLEARFDNLENSEKIQEALEIIDYFDNDDGSDLVRSSAKRGKFFAVVDDLGEGFWSVDGLMAYKAYSDAVKSGDSSFTTNLFREVDGVTNGVSIGTVQSAEFISNAQQEEMFYKILEKTGVYTEDSPYSSYNDYRSIPGNADNYEEAGSYLDPFADKEETVAAINLKTKERDTNKPDSKKRAPLTDNSANMLFLFMSNFLFSGTKTIPEYRENMDKGDFSNIFYDSTNEGIEVLRSEVRKIMKNPTMILNYGAALNTVVNAMFEASLQSVYTNAAKDPESMKSFASSFNSVISALYPEKSANAMTITDEQLSNPNNFELTSFQKAVLKSYFSMTFSGNLANYLDTVFGANQTMQEVLTAKSNLAYLNYVKKLDIATTEAEEAKGYPLNENEKLALRKELETFAPILLSVNGKDTINEGIYLGKDGPEYSKNKQQSTIGSPVAGLRVESIDPKTSKNKTKKINMPGFKIESPGVNISALGVQHLDASIMAEVLLSEYKGMNIHDAYAAGILDTEEFSQELNKAYKKVVTNYSLNSSIDSPATLAAQEADDTLDYYAKKLGIDSTEFEAIESNMTKYLGDILAFDSLDNGQGYKDSLTKFGNYDGTTTDSTYTTSEPKQYSAENIEEAVNDVPSDSRNTISGATFDAEAVKQIRKSDVLDIPTEFNDNFVGVQGVPIADKNGNIFAYVTPANNGTYSIITKDATSAIKAKGGSKLRSALKVSYNSAIKDTDTFGSSATGFNKNDFADTEGQILSSERINQTFDTLTQLNTKDSTEHVQTLKDVIDNLVSKAIPSLKNLKLFERKEQDTNLGAYEVTGKGTEQEQNNIYISVGDNKAAFRAGMSAAETFVHEMLHGTLAYSIDNNAKLRKELRDLYLKVKNSGLGPEAFLNLQEVNGQKGVIYNSTFYPEGSGTYKEIYKNAKERFDYIFSNETSKKVTNTVSGKKTESFTNNYLHEFAVFGLTNSEFIESLKNIDPTTLEGNKDKKVLNVLKRWFEKAMTAFGLSTIRPDDNAYSLLYSVAEDMAVREEKYHGGIYSLLDTADSFVSNNLVKNATGKFDKADIKNSLLGNTPIIGDALSAIQNFRNAGPRANQLVVNTLLTNTGKITNNAVKQGGLDVINELTGPTSVTRPFETLRRIKNNMIDRAKQNLMADIAKTLMNSMNKELTKDEGIRITKGLIYTNVAALGSLSEEGTYDFNMDEIGTLVSDKKARNAEITKVEAEIKNEFPKLARFFSASADNLGYFIVTGQAKYKGNMALNPEVIIKDALDKKGLVLSAQQKLNAERLLSRLTVLQALNSSDATDLVETGRLIKADPEGMRTVLGTHRVIQENAKKELFSGSTMLMRFGYTSEKLNEDASYKTVSESELKDAERKGFAVIGELKQDKDEGLQKKAFMVYRSYGGKNAFDSGATSMTGMKAQGTDLYHRHLTNNSSSNQAFKDFQRVKSAKSKQSIENRVPVNNDAQLIPVRNNEGEVVEYRYMMSREIKNTYLNRNDNYATVLGKTAASSYDKVKSTELNRELVEKAYEEFKRVAPTEASQFILVGPDSADPEAQKVYSMLPDDMKNHIVSTWGMNGNMYVHRDVWKHLFGQRKMTVNSLSYANPEAYKGMDRVAILAENTMNYMLNNKYGIFAESTWQQVVSLAKDSIVIKGISTLKNNIVSNQLVLIAMGIDPLTAYKWQKEGYMAAKDFERNSQRITEITYMMQSNSRYATSKKLKQELTELQEEQANNPVKDLLDAGVYQTIAEDIYTLEDSSAIGGFVEDKLDKVINKTGKTGAKVINTALLRHDTVVYDFLKEATQMSDFMARYALHKKNLSKGMEFDDSVNNIVDTFVDYDTPTNRYLQYANDMGLVMFTKYFLRIQKVLFNGMRDRPFSAAMLIGLQAATGVSLPDIYDGNITNPPGLNSPLDTIRAIYNNHPLGYILRQF